MSPKSPRKYEYKNRFDRFDSKLMWNNFYQGRNPTGDKETPQTYPVFTSPSSEKDLQEAIQKHDLGNIWCPDCGARMDILSFEGRMIESFIQEEMKQICLGYKKQRVLQCSMSRRSSHRNPCSNTKQYPLGNPQINTVARYLEKSEQMSRIVFESLSLIEVSAVVQSTLPKYNESVTYQLDKLTFTLEGTLDPHVFVLHFKSRLIEINREYLLNFVGNVWDVDNWIESYAGTHDVISILYDYYLRDSGCTQFTETGIVVDGLYHQYHIDWFGIPRYLLKDGQYSNRICLIPTEIKDFQALIDPELLATLETFGLKLKWIDIVILAKTFYLMNDNQYAETDPIFASQVRPKPAITFRNLPPWVH